MSTKSPRDLNRDLGPGFDEQMESEWSTTKRKYECTTNKDFNEIINELLMIKKKDKKNELRHNDRNVELLVQAGRLAPPSEFYPHLEIEALFAKKKTDQLLKKTKTFKNIFWPHARQTCRN